MLKVVKFGGSSMADAGQYQKIRNILSADPTRRIVVVSAAGKRNSKKDADVINQIIALAQSLLDEPEDKPTEDEEKSEEAQPEVNEASEEPKDEGNSKRAGDLLEKIKSMKEVPDHDDEGTAQ